MRTQDRTSGKPGVTVTPVSWRRMLVLFLLIATVSVLAAGIMYDDHRGTPNPNPSPTCASAQC